MALIVHSSFLLGLAVLTISCCSTAAQPHSRGDTCDVTLLQTKKSVETACTLPPNAKWCTVSLGGEFREFQMAVYDLRDDDRDDIVSKTICRYGTWEMTYADLAALGKPGHALDIGANVGFYSLLLAAAGWNVTSFEPMPENNALIEASLCQNPSLKSRVTLHKFGLGPKDDHCMVYSDYGNVGDGVTQCGSKAQNVIPAGSEKRADITVRRLDDILEQQKVKSIDFVKIDVEGYECQVMSGAHSLLSKFRPRFIQSEVWPQMQGCSPGQYLSSFADAHYKVTKDKHCFMQDQSAPTVIDNRYMCRESITGDHVISLLHVPEHHRSIVCFHAA